MTISTPTAPTAVNQINQITQQELAYFPSVLAGVQAAEAAGGTGQSKFHAVLDTISGISGALAQAPGNPTVQSIAVLINISVAIFNALGQFKHKTA